MVLGFSMNGGDGAFALVAGPEGNRTVSERPG